MDLPRLAIHHLFCDLILFWKSLISKLFPLPRILTGCWVLNIARFVCAQPGLRIASSRANMLFQAVRSMRSSGMYPRSPGSSYWSGLGGRGLSLVRTPVSWLSLPGVHNTCRQATLVFLQWTHLESWSCWPVYVW